MEEVVFWYKMVAVYGRYILDLLRFWHGQYMNPKLVFRSFDLSKNDIKVENISDHKAFSIEITTLNDYQSIVNKYLWETVIFFKRIDILDGKSVANFEVNA